jgi:acylphosphatase
MKKRVRLLISGLVQGVFFRDNTKRKAKELGLFGFVRNLIDGRVEAVFEGEKEKIEKMIEWAKEGPSLAKVEKIEIEWQEYQGEFDDFEIRY